MNKTEDPEQSEPSNVCGEPFDCNTFDRSGKEREESEENVPDERDQFPLNLFHD